MKAWFKSHESLLVALGALIWFLVMTPWGSFAEIGRAHV
jgi:hypothetical protein